MGGSPIKSPNLARVAASAQTEDKDQVGKSESALTSTIAIYTHLWRLATRNFQFPLETKWQRLTTHSAQSEISLFRMGTIFRQVDNSMLKPLILWKGRAIGDIHIPHRHIAVP
jgi:hypothetical protein